MNFARRLDWDTLAELLYLNRKVFQQPKNFAAEVMVIFTDELIQSIQSDPVNGVIELIGVTRKAMLNDPNSWHDTEQEALMQAYALISEIIDAKILNISPPLFSISGHLDQDCLNISQYLNEIDAYCQREFAQLKLISMRSRFKAALGSGFGYEFSQGDLDRVQQLINEMRDHLTASHALEDDHRQRLLKRLERLQVELHKKVSDLDRFWGLIGDAGIVLGKLGTDAKPLVDRIREMVDIVWRTQSRAEELPSGTGLPLLGDNARSAN